MNGEELHYSASKEPNFVRRVRDTLRVTQAEMARMLRVSTRAVQSYEQAWREVPDSMAVQLLTLLAIWRMKTDAEHPPCWEQTGCLPDTRSACPSFRATGGRFCWLAFGSRLGREHRVDQVQGDVAGLRRALDGVLHSGAGHAELVGLTELLTAKSFFYSNDWEAGG
jgi:DNA-binding XRE family transcriptional regulator